MINERIRKILDSVATKEDKKIILMYKGKKYTLETYTKTIIPQYVIIKGEDLLLKTNNGYIKVEDFLYDIIADYKNQNEEIKEIAKKGKIKDAPSTINDKFMQLVIQKPSLASLIYDSKYMLNVIINSENSKMIWYHMPDKFKKDEAFMLRAIKYKSSNYYYADVDLKRDKRFSLKCASIDGLLLKEMSGTYNEDISFEPDRDALGNVYNYAERTYTLKDDCDIIETAVRENPEAIKYAKFSDFMLNDNILSKQSIEYTSRVKSIMIEVISYNPDFYIYTPAKLKNDEEIITAYNISKANIKGKSKCIKVKL